MTRLDDATLVAYADGELDADAMRVVAEAIKQDPAAKEKVRLLRQGASLVRTVFDDPCYLQVPSAVAETVAVPRSKSSARFARRWPFAMPLAAALAAAALFAGGFTLGEIHSRQPSDFSERLLDEVADYHVTYAQDEEHQVEVPADRLKGIEAWLGKRLHRKLQVPDLSSHGLVFAGARLLVVDSEPVAQLLYHWPNQPKHPLGLCISFSRPGTQAPTTDRREGVNLVLWRRDGYSYVLVGWADPSFLDRLAAELATTLGET